MLTFDRQLGEYIELEYFPFINLANKGLQVTLKQSKVAFKMFIYFPITLQFRSAKESFHYIPLQHKSDAGFPITNNSIRKKAVLLMPACFFNSVSFFPLFGDFTDFETPATIPRNKENCVTENSGKKP